MRIFHFAAAACVIAAGAFAVASWAGPESKDKKRNTPPGWSYELRDGKRVPRVPRTVNPDGSWTEVIRQGNCTVTRTGREGAVREVRKCD